ncbi:MAG: YCF48-related protein [Bacteroidia bacterium]
MKQLILFAFSLLISTFSFAQTPGWNYLPNAPTAFGAARFDDIYFVNPDVGWAVNGDGQIFKTADGGTNWTLQLSTSDYFRSVEFLNADTGFAGTLSQEFYQTTDGGTTWINIDSVFTQSVNGICGMSHVGNNIYAVGIWYQPAQFLKSTDAGQTWSVINMSTHARALVDAWFINTDTGFVSGQEAVTGMGVILKTTDGGITWTKVYATNYYNDYCWKLFFTATGIGYASVESTVSGVSQILKSTDGGDTWQLKMVTPIQNIDMEGVGFINDSVGWCGGWSNGMWETTDGGDNWTFLNFGSNLNRVFKVNDTLVYAGGYSIYKYTDTATGISDPSPMAYKHELKIKQNPVTDNSIIEFTLDVETFLILEIFDVQGKVIKQFAGGIFKKGIYEYPISAKDFVKGNYIVSLRTNEHFLSQKITFTGR